MAVKASSKERVLNMVYSLGAAVVILGALCKINHLSLGFISGSAILALGLIVEALIFIVFAFDTPKGDYEWDKVYPELTNGSLTSRKAEKSTNYDDELSTSLSAKLDNMLSQAKLDVSLFENLRKGIQNFEESVGEINKTLVAADSTKRYSEQISQAANHIESLNAMYQLQLEDGKRLTQINQRFIDEISKAGEVSSEFKRELEGLSSNLNNLNKVYGGMLHAMKL